MEVQLLRLGNGDKYLVDVFTPQEPVKPTKAAVEALKEVFKNKAFSRMKIEAVNCPIMQQVVSFPNCFACSNFNRRVSGKIGCRGVPITGGTVA